MSYKYGLWIRSKYDEKNGQKREREKLTVESVHLCDLSALVGLGGGLLY